MKVTAKSRYNAAVRLQRQGRFAFFTTTILSLGLIFIPLMQNTGVSLALGDKVLNMMQIFLAVAVLVYSVVIGTARYDVRAEKLTECGDRLKELIREMDNDRQAGPVTGAALTGYQSKYSDVVTDSENHTRGDYYLAILEMRAHYFFTGWPRFQYWLSAHVSRAVAFIVPVLMILLEIVFITDMMGVTEILTPFLKGRHS